MARNNSAFFFDVLGKRKRGLLKYEMGKLLGSGSFGDVYAARRKKDDLPVSKETLKISISCSRV